MSSNKQDYLKRYLSHEIKEENAPKKKKKIRKHSRNIKIYDDDLDLKKLEAEQVEDSEIGDEAPIIIGEAKGPEAQNKWKAIIKEEPQNEENPSNVRTRHDSDSDQSPPRNHQRTYSPPRDPKEPPNNKGAGSKSPNHSTSLSENNMTRHDSDSDLSPPRKKPALSPDSSKLNGKRMRKESNDSDLSPPRASRDADKGKRKEREKNDSDISPPRSSFPADKDSDSDLSPPRRKCLLDEEGSDLSPPRRKRNSPSPDSKGAKPKKGGLMRLSEHRKDMEARKAQEPKVDMSMGKDAAPIVRKKKLDPEEEKKQKEKEEQEKIKKQKYAEWGKGLKQAENKQANIDDALAEMAKPLARYKDDKDLDSMLRDQERSGDPMLEYIRKKQQITKGGKSHPRYQGPPPPQNRFNILPGYRWDGVDRSNGYEVKLLSKKAEKIAIEEEAYRWSVQDM